MPLLKVFGTCSATPQSKCDCRDWLTLIGSDAASHGMGASVSEIKRLRVFLSSPGDVSSARAVIRDAIEMELAKQRVFENAKLEVVSWDDPFAPLALDAYLTPQQAIDRHLPMPSQCDVVVVILWSRMGTPLAH